MNTYHDTTKHSYWSVRHSPNYLDWSIKPSEYKNYPKHSKSIQLDTTNTIQRFLYLICGITAKKTYPSMEYYIRSNPSAGALYPNEVYFQARNVKGFEDGIYHLCVSRGEATYLHSLPQASGLEYFLNDRRLVDGLLFLVSGVYYRSSWKYKNRALRYVLLDGGHILGSIESNALWLGDTCEIFYAYDKVALNELFCFDRGEFFIGGAFVGHRRNIQATKPNITISYANPTYTFEANSIIEEGYKTSLAHLGQITPNKSKISTYFEPKRLQEAIEKRRSIREFSKVAMSKAELDGVLDFVMDVGCFDVDEWVDVYYCVHNVDGVAQGLYKNRVLIKEGDFRQMMGYLSLEQAIGAQSGVTFVLASSGSDYQALYQKAGLLGHRLYVASTYFGVGCSGIGAYYDDEVREFLNEEGMILYLIAVGI